MIAKKVSRPRRHATPLPLKNPFVPEIRRKPWTAVQRADIKKAFDSDTRRSRAQAIDAFVSHIEQTFEFLRVDSSLGEVAQRLERLEDSARVLLKALFSCANHEARRWVGGLLHVYVTWARDWREPDPRIQAPQRWDIPTARQFAADLRALAEGRHAGELLRQVWILTTAIQIAAHESHIGLPKQRSLSRERRLKFEVVRQLRVAWRAEFGSRAPRTNRNGEFHRVATAVGKLLDINIGWRALNSTTLPT